VKEAQFILLVTPPGLFFHSPGFQLVAYLHCDDRAENLVPGILLTLNKCAISVSLSDTE
jgi:hypothetical protein